MSKKTKVFISVLSATCAVLLAVIIPLFIFKIGLTVRLETPTKPTVYQTENLISFETSEVKNAVGYVFEITLPTENGTVLKFESASNVLVLDFTDDLENSNEEFNLAGIYNVSVYAVAKKEKDNSFKSLPATFERTFKLNTPNLEKQSGQLSWSLIDDADYYAIYISSNSVSEIFTALAPETTALIDDIKTDLNLQPDYYTFCIKACNYNKYILDSDFSNVLEFYIHD